MQLFADLDEVDASFESTAKPAWIYKPLIKACLRVKTTLTFFVSTITTVLKLRQGILHKLQRRSSMTVIKTICPN